MTQSNVGPRVTVFVPTRNRSHLLRGTVDSLLAQTFQDFVIRVSDNASTDRTPDVVRSYRDPRVGYHRHEQDIGIRGNHDWCIRHIDTEYGLLISDDDLAYPELLERTVAFLDAHPDVGVVHTAFDVIDDDGRTVLTDENWTHNLAQTTVEDPRTFIDLSMVFGCRIGASTAMMRRVALPKDGMQDEDFPAIDLGFWLRMAGGGWQMAFLGETLGAYRIHGSSHSALFGAPTGASYSNGDQMVDRLLAVKERFISTHVADAAQAERLRALARKGLVWDLVDRVRVSTLPERPFVPTMKGLYAAARQSPRVLVSPQARRLAIGSMLPQRVASWLTERRAAASGRVRREVST
jgi:GT2 family glycosyltransferase